MKSKSRPLGGISALTLGVVSAEGTAPSLSEEGINFRLLEDRSTYTQVEVWSDGQRSVKHTLEVVTPIEYTLSEELEAGTAQGFAALISLNSCDQIEVGTTLGEPLWLTSCTAISGAQPSSRGYKVWTFESLTMQEIEQGGDDSDESLSPNGVSALLLAVASSEGEAPNFDDEALSIPLLMDLSTYTEKAEFVGAQQSVEHSLLLYTAVDYSLPEALLGGLSRGFVARVEFNSSQVVSVGWSAEAAADRALRLVSCSVGCSTKSESIYYKEWLFESTDGVSNI
ncbi:MAG: hypothetical protein SNI51_00205 [Rikenellaceae bacterium]